MINRKILYGYQIQNGELAAQPAEAVTVGRIYALYTEGASYQKIADTLNGDGIPFCREAPAWNKHKVKRVLENPRYTGVDGYPVLVDAGVFQTVRDLIREKTAGNVVEDRPVLRLMGKLRCQSCGKALRRLAGANRRKDTLYLKCDQCGMTVTLTDAALLAEVDRQTAEHDAPPAPKPYEPSEAVIRLNNAVDRGLEHPDQPEDVISLILQGVAARYDCFPSEPISKIPLRLTERNAFGQAVSHITISADNAVTVTFQ